VPPKDPHSKFADNAGDDDSVLGLGGMGALGGNLLAGASSVAASARRPSTKPGGAGAVAAAAAALSSTLDDFDGGEASVSVAAVNSHHQNVLRAMNLQTCLQVCAWRRACARNGTVYSESV